MKVNECAGALMYTCVREFLLIGEPFGCIHGLLNHRAARVFSHGKIVI